MLEIIVIAILVISYLWDASRDKKLTERVYGAVESHQKQEIERLKSELEAAKKK